MKETHEYDDIINMPHRTSPTRNKMSVSDRAAQFSPFAALTGYEDAVKETARLTDTKTELDENRKALLDEKLRLILDCIEDEPEITVTYFAKDARKKGGAYVTKTGAVKRIDEYERCLYFTDNLSVDIDCIYEIEGDIFISLI